MGRIRTGLVGVGRLGVELGQHVRQHPAAVLEGIADVDEGVLADAGDLLDVDERDRFRDHETLFERRDLDAVVIVTPHTLHYDQVTAALDHDIHVLCEKPLVTGLEDALALQRQLEKTDVQLMVGYQRHLEPAYVRVAEELAQTNPTFVTAEISENWIQKYDGTWRVNPALSGGGFLQDTGSHLLDALLWMTGLQPESVLASMGYHDDGDVDVRGQLHVECREGAMLNVSLPGDVARLGEFVHIWDDRGSLYINGHHWEEYEVVRAGADGTRATLDLGDDADVTKIDAFLESIRTGSTPPATIEHAVRVTALKEAAQESARTGTKVPVEITRS